MGFIEGFKRGYEGDYSYEVAGQAVACSHCGEGEFGKSEAQLNTAALSFFGLDWANRSATVLVCRNCGHLEWFI